MSTPQAEGDTLKVNPDITNFERMMAVVRHMREIPELPSEKLDSKDSSILQNVEFPEEGGVLTYMSDQAEPYKGFPFHEMVDKIDLVKKVVRSTLSSFFHSFKRRNKLQLASIVFASWFIGDSIKAGIYTFFRVVERFKIKPKMYSTSMRELHRAFSIELDNESAQDKELRFQTRDLVCMILEFDNAYRFRFQDIIGELDKEALQKNASKELIRLLTLMQSREKEQTVKDTWTLLKTFLPYALFLNRGIKKKIVAILSSLDLSLVRFSKEDKNYCIPRKDYTFGFQKNPTEEDLAQIQKLTESRLKTELKAHIRSESTKAHEELFARHKTELVIDSEVEKKIIEETTAFLQRCNDEGNIRYNEGRQAIIKNYLTPEQIATIQRHAEETDKMNKEYESKLQAIE